VLLDEHIFAHEGANEESPVQPPELDSLFPNLQLSTVLVPLQPVPDDVPPMKALLLCDRVLGVQAPPRCVQKG